MILNFFVAIIMGIISGYGIGGGSIFIIYMTYFLGYSQLIAQGINLVYFIFASTPALYSHIKNKLICKKAFIYCSISGGVTSILSAFIANMIDIQLLKRFFGIFLLYVGIKLIFSKKNQRFLNDK